MDKILDADDIIEKKCCNCEYATDIKNTERYLCKKHGVVSYNFVCRKFSFDPLKLSPRLPAKRVKFSAGDFAL